MRSSLARTRVCLRHPSPVHVVALVALAALAASPSHAGWAPDLAPAGVDGAVHASVEHHGDWVIGGAFVGAGGSTARYVARWDGSAWTAVGDGPPTPSLALLSFDDALHSGGPAGNGSAVHVARDGRWQPVGTRTGRVEALVEHASGIVSGGVDPAVATLSADGDWRELPGLDGRVHALAVHDGALIAGGTAMTGGRGHVHRWTGSAWAPVGTFLDAPVRALAMLGGDLVAGGSFESSRVSAAAGAPGDRSLANVARFDGASWQPMASGLDDEVRVLVPVRDGVLAGGFFTRTGDGRTFLPTRLARWTGSAWRPVGSIDARLDDAVRSVVPLRDLGGALADGAPPGGVLVAGSFVDAGDRRLGGVARLDGDGAHLVGGGSAVDGRVHAIHVDGDAVILGGEFTHVGGVAISRIARRTASGWAPLGEGVDDAVWAITGHDGDLIAGGDFLHAGGTPVNHVARFDGDRWHPMGEGLDGLVLALTSYRGQVIAGGFFSATGGELVGPLVTFDETADTWRPLDRGANAPVYLLQVDGDGLLVGGDFTLPHRFLSRWDGSGWTDVASGLDAPAFAAVRWRGDLVLGGAFTRVDGRAASHVARRTADGWTAVAGGTRGPAADRPGTVNGLAVIDDQLVAAGEFVGAGDVDAAYVARTDGTRWRPLDEGLDARANTAVAAPDGVWIAGRFTEAGGRRSPFLARWSPDDGD